MAIKASAQYTISDIFEEYSVILSNDAHVFRADKDNKAIAGNTSIKIYGYQGSTQISTKVGTISGLPSAGMTATIANNNSTNTTITIAVTTALTSSVANNGTLTIPITVGNKTINKIFSWSKAQTGATGATGSSGTNAYVHIRYSDDNLKFTGNSGQDLGAFIGICSTNSSTAPTTFSSYKWSKLSDYAGLNKWKVDVYTKTTVSGNSSVLTMSDLLANETFKTSFLIEDSQSTTWGYGDNFLAVVTTYAYFTDTYTMSTTAKSDDASSIYLNDVKIYDLVSCQATSVTVNFVKGWNKVQFLMNEQAGEEYAYFSQKISELEKVKFMSAYEEDKAKVGEQGLKGDTGATGATGKSIGSITNYYLATSASSNVTTSTSGWTTTIQTVTSSKKYLWNYVVTKYTDNTVASTTTPCIIGVYGDKGDKGDKGTSITISKTETVYQVGSSATSKPTGTWTTTIPATNGKNKYLWSRVTITYSDGHKTEAYSVSSTMDSITVGGNNLIFKGRGDKKEGFFTNFTIDSTTGELGLQHTSKGNYTGTSLNPGFLVKPRDYKVGSQLTWSYEIKYTKWDVPNNSNIRELWMGQRYTSPPSGETGTGNWRSITSTNLPKVDNKTYQLNKWYRIIQTITIPEAASDNVGTQGTLSFYYLNSADKTESATIAFQLRNVKLEYGNIATDWTPSESETMSRDEINSSVNSAISGAKTYTDTEINKSAEKITSDIQEVSGKLELETTARQVENEKNGKKIRDLQLYTSQLKMSGNELSLNIDKTKGVNLLKNSVMKQYKERGGTGANSKTIKANFWLNKELKEDYFSTITYGEDGVSRSNTDSGSFFRFNFSGDNATKLDYIFSDPIDFKKNASNIILSYKLRKTQTLSNGIFFIGLVFYKTDASSTGMGSVINSTNGIPTGYYVPLAEYTDGVLNGSFTSDFIYKTLPITRHGDTDVQKILEVKQETVNGVIQKYIELSYTPSAAKSTVTITTFDDKTMAYTGTSKKIIITDTSIETDSVVTVSYTRSLNNFIAMTNPTSAKIVAELNKAPVTDVNIYYNSSNKKIWTYNPFTGVFKESNNLFDEKVADTNIDSVRVIIGARSTNDKTLLGQIDISDLKLEYDSVSTIWTQNVGETYSKQYKMDEKGFSISSDTNTMFIDEDEIAAYKVDNNTGELDTSNPVFQIKEDETILRQTTIYNQLNIENTTETREDAFVMKQENVNGKWFYIFY